MGPLCQYDEYEYVNFLKLVVFCWVLQWSVLGCYLYHTKPKYDLPTIQEEIQDAIQETCAQLKIIIH